MMLLMCKNCIKSDNCTLLCVTYFSDTCPVRFQYTSRLCASDSCACADEGFTRIKLFALYYAIYKHIKLVENGFVRNVSFIDFL